MLNHFLAEKALHSRFKHACVRAYLDAYLPIYREEQQGRFSSTTGDLCGEIVCECGFHCKCDRRLSRAKAGKADSAVETCSQIHNRTHHPSMSNLHLFDLFGGCGGYFTRMDSEQGQSDKGKISGCVDVMLQRFGSPLYFLKGG
jgi:hypothetical protein